MSSHPPHTGPRQSSRRRAALWGLVVFVPLWALIMFSGSAGAGVARAADGAGRPGGSAASGNVSRAAVLAGEEISSFRSEVKIRRDGAVDITETIVYDFGSSERHGIERWIPVRFDVESAALKGAGRKAEPGVQYQRVTPLSNLSVSSPERGTPTDVESEQQGDYTYLRIGDPDVTVSGKHTYVLRYRLGAVLNSFSDHDELFLNITGNEATVPTGKASARVEAPGSINRIACFQGPYRSTLNCDEASQTSESSAEFVSSGLAARAGLTVVVAMPKGVVAPAAPIFEEVWSLQRAFQLTPATGVATAGLAAGVVGLVSLLGFRVGRDRRFQGGATDRTFGNSSGAEERVPLGDRNPVPVEYTPPEGIRPGQVGTLIDEVAHPLDISATIVDLAVRGHLRIEEVMTGPAVTDYSLVRLSGGEGDLRPYEERLLGYLFATGSSVSLAGLKQNFHAQFAEIQNELYRDAVAQGWFQRRPDKERTRWAVLGFVVFALGAGLTVLLAATTRWALPAVVVPLAGVALMLLSHKMPHRTGKGYGMYQRIVGFKELFLAGEGERQDWLEQENLFSRYLPYAMVYGCADRWAARFAELAAAGRVAPDTFVWWSSPRPFDWIIFSRSIDNFGTMASGTLAAAAPSSAAGGFSGFGGGGFSGGGFGGGGTGSW